MSEINKRWQVYYGLDFRMSISNSDVENPYPTADNLRRTLSNRQSYGLAPVLGFRFKLNKRLSLTTESSITLNYMRFNGSTSYTYLGNRIEYKVPAGSSVYSSFSQPLSVIVTIDI